MKVAGKMCPQRWVVAFELLRKGGLWKYEQMLRTLGGWKNEEMI